MKKTLMLILLTLSISNTYVKPPMVKEIKEYLDRAVNELNEDHLKIQLYKKQLKYFIECAAHAKDIDKVKACLTNAQSKQLNNAMLTKSDISYFQQKYCPYNACSIGEIKSWMEIELRIAREAFNGRPHAIIASRSEKAT